MLQFNTRKLLVLLYSISLLFLIYLLIESLISYLTPVKITHTGACDPANTPHSGLETLIPLALCGPFDAFVIDIARAMQRLFIGFSAIFILVQLPIFLSLVFKREWFNKNIILKIGIWIALIPSFAAMAYILMAQISNFYNSVIK